MNWIKANTFLSGFFGAMLVGILVLGYLLMSARGRYEDINAQYEEQSTELNRLQSAAPFPAPANLEKVKEQRKQHQEAIGALQVELAKNEMPIEPISEVQFQDRLRESVGRIRAEAAKRGTKLPEKGFFLGFDIYEGQPPRPEAAPLLGRQLKAIELVTMQIIEAGAVSLDNLERPQLAQEGDRQPAGQESSGSGNQSDDRRSQSSEKPLVTREPFTISFTASQDAFRSVLNNVSNSKAQFFIVRAVTIKSEMEKAPSRAEASATPAPGGAATPPAGEAPAVAGTDAGAGAAATAGAAGTAAAPGAPGAAPVTAAAPGAAAATADELKLVVGDENIKVDMRVEIVDFADAPAVADATK